MPAIQVDLYTYTDADFCQAFKLQIGDPVCGVIDYYDFTGKTLIMKVRRDASDAEVFVSLTSSTDGIAPGNGGIDIYAEDGVDEMNVFAITIPMSELQKMSEGTYVQSLVIDHPDGCREELWRGNLINTIGPSR